VLATWSTAKVGPDIHAKVGKTLYSVPWRLIGQRLDARETHNYKDKATLERDLPYTRGGRAGVSVFLREGDRVFHTYSAYGRSAEQHLGTHQYLDLTPLGRQRYVTDFQYHNTYDAS